MEVTRRQFLQLTATGAVTVSPLGFDLEPATQIKQTLRIDGAKVSHTICPYCAVGCAMLAYTKTQPDGRVELLQLEGDPDSPVNEGRLCPKGASALQLAVSRRRIPSPLYREPGAHGVPSRSPGTSPWTGSPATSRTPGTVRSSRPTRTATP